MEGEIKRGGVREGGQNGDGREGRGRRWVLGSSGEGESEKEIMNREGKGAWKVQVRVVGG